MKKILAAVVMVLSLGLAGSAFADVHGSNTMQVTATVIYECTVTTTGIHFGSIADPTGGATANGEIHVMCPDATGYSIALDKGQHAFNDGTAFTRHLVDGSGVNKMQYEIYSDVPTGGTVWGDSGLAATYPDGAEVTGLTGNGTFQSYPVYAEILNVAAIPPAGTYTDMVGVTVEY